MKNLKIYACSDDHLNYAEEMPEYCGVCGSMSLTLVYGVMVSVEGGSDGLSEESEDCYSKE